MASGIRAEDEAAFEELCDFLGEQKLQRVGAFPYSPEEGTPAAEFPDQVDEEIRKKRGEIIMEQQYNIFEKLNHDNIGKTMRCVVEGYDGYTDSYYGRTWRDAPDIDGSVSFTCGYELNEGDFVDVEIFDVNEYDLIGEVI